MILIWSTDSNAHRTSEVLDGLYRMLLNYDNFKHRIEKTNLLLLNLVKPESVTTNIFLK